MTTLSLSQFLPHVGEAFRLAQADDNARAFDLLQAEALPSGWSPGHAGFSLEFTTAAPGAPLSQGTYTLHHPVLGPLQLFLVPIARSEERVHYQSIIN